jgi:fructan beta-fructosidase
MPDFRDPKVFLYNGTWIMVIAAGNRVQFYESENLTSWRLVSEFGAEPLQGSHAGTWECPDLRLIRLPDQTSSWVLIVSCYGCSANGGSGTQYFIGDFDGRTFTSPQFDPLWLDWGVDNYAGVTFSNEPTDRTILIGWMTNLDYAEVTPTGSWRGQMTLPRQLDLTLVDGRIRLQSSFPAEFAGLVNEDQKYKLSSATEIGPDNTLILTDSIHWRNTLLQLDLAFEISEFGPSSSISICFYSASTEGAELCLGYDEGRERNLFLDRERSGDSTFSDRFPRRATATREIREKIITFQIILDVSAIEVFVDGGLTCFVSLFYPQVPFDLVEVRHHALSNPDSRLTLLAAFVNGLNSQL